jgi:hypothetical protein
MIRRERNQAANAGADDHDQPARTVAALHQE